MTKTLIAKGDSMATTNPTAGAAGRWATGTGEPRVVLKRGQHCHVPITWPLGAVPYVSPTTNKVTPHSCCRPSGFENSEVWPGRLADRVGCA